MKNYWKNAEAFTFQSPYILQNNTGGFCPKVRAVVSTRPVMQKVFLMDFDFPGLGFISAGS